MIKISSNHNPEIKFLNLLNKKSTERKKSGNFVIEGLREIKRAIKKGYSIKTLFIHEKALLDEIDDQINLKKFNSLYVIKKSLFEKITYRSGSEKVIAIAETKIHTLNRLKLPQNPFVLVIEAPEKPGNIGAILRTCSAVGIDAVIIANPKTDIYNPNIIRSSLGAVFSNQIATDSSKKIISFLKEKKIRVIVSALKKNSTSFNNVNYTLPCAIVLGSEDQGLTNNWLTIANEIIRIPMSENIDSLNLSVSAGILMYEAIKQNKKINLLE